jgi:hypothetical protein
MRVDSGDSTDIIHKRILKGTRRWANPAVAILAGVYPQKLALFAWN